MMHKKSTVKASLFTLILAFMIAGTVTIKAATQNNRSSKEVEDKSSKSKTLESKLVDEPYYYTGPETSDMNILRDTTHWQSTPPSEFTCGGDAEVPCSIPAASQADLLSKLTASTSLNDVLNLATNRREESN